MKKEKAPNMALQWAKFIAVLVLYLLFLYWVKSWWGLIVVPFIFDVYITKKIKWQWWKDAEGPVRFVMSWVDALVFALVAVYFINLFFFQNYVIPSSSLEKSLLTGDYLFVSKVSYGPRIPETPLTLPLTQHTLPVFECKSYIDWPHWDYRRVKGLGKVELNDIVVFNFPAGDTLCSAPQYQAYDFYQMCYGIGYQLYPQRPNPDSLTAEQRLKFYQTVYQAGRAQIAANFAEYGDIITRPADRRENYVKRCVGLPGQTFEIRDKVVYVDGEKKPQPELVQFNYKFYTKNGQILSDRICADLGISDEDRSRILDRNNGMALTYQSKAALEKMTDLVDSIVEIKDGYFGRLYPLDHDYGWTRDNYGPVLIPAKGMKIDLNMENIAIYERPIRTYEGNQLDIRRDGIFINGQKADSYTFKMDYYWMMGDNRHNSADSRYWGFVPEDHVVGKPLFIWLSISPDNNPEASTYRWNRLFKWVGDIK
jgi:signal peptidase I